MATLDNDALRAWHFKQLRWSLQALATATSEQRPLFPDAAAIQRELLAKHPDLADVNRSIFAGRPLATQFRIQAQGERLGAATWRSFAKRESDVGARATYLACAELEEASALVLEALI